jgi:hypothetical protein
MFVTAGLEIGSREERQERDSISGAEKREGEFPWSEQDKQEREPSTIPLTNTDKQKREVRKSPTQTSIRSTI